jgi:hypothetical protein
MDDDMENMRLASVRRRENTQTEYVYVRVPAVGEGRTVSSVVSTGVRAGAWIGFELLTQAPGALGAAIDWVLKRVGFLMFCGVGGAALVLRELGDRTLKAQAEYIRHRRPEMPAQWILKVVDEKPALPAGDNVKRLRADNEED